MTKPPPVVSRLAAAALWILSIAFLFRALTMGTTAEESLFNPHLTAADQAAIHQQSQIADRYLTAGWILQSATAAVLSFGLNSPRMVRRIFLSLGILIAADGTTLLLTAVIIR